MSETEVSVPGGGRRRRRANALGKRTQRVVITHTPEEMSRVRAMAASQGVTPPRLYMRALSTGDVEAAAKVQRVRDELLAARRLLAAVSNNVNQIATVANATGEIGEELSATLQAVRRASARIERVAGDVEEYAR